MALIRTNELIHDAIGARRGIAAFNVLHLETAEAIVSASETAGIGVILQISENCVMFHRGLAPLARASFAIAAASTTPVAIHLDHAEDEDLAREAIDLGFGSVMFDGSKLSYSANIEATARVVAHAHRAGAAVEAELGEIGGKGGAHVPGARTDPDEARQFVADTAVDSLAVAVGSSHAMIDRTATLDFDLIRILSDALSVPLVLHGSSGVGDQDLAAAIRAGMTKINISTQLNKHFTAGVREYMEANPSVVDSRKYMAHGRQRLEDEALRLIVLLATLDPKSGEQP